MHKNVRDYFDQYILDYSTWHEIIEVLRYTHLFGEQCVGRIYKRKQKKLPEVFDDSRN